MKMFKSISLFAAFAATTLVPAFAATPAMRVNVPFAFIVGNQKLAAGQYAVETASENGNGVVLIQGEGHAVAVLTSPLLPARPDSKASLVFQSSQDGAHLVKIQMEGEPSRSVALGSSLDHSKLTASR
jgi:hypothetical protein